MNHKDFDPKKYQHIHNRGFENRIIFSSEEDFDRFEAYLYLLNSLESPRVANIFARKGDRDIFENARGEKLVAIASYSFIPREFHLLVTPLVDGGIAKFMQKLQTAYTMYFNHKYQRTGILFQSSYQRQTIATEDRLKFFHALIHLLPSQLFNEEWRELDVFNLERIAASALQYRYSSIGEYQQSCHRITSPEEFPRSLTRNNNLRSYVRIWNAYQKTTHE